MQRLSVKGMMQQKATGLAKVLAFCSTFALLTSCSSSHGVAHDVAVDNTDPGTTEAVSDYVIGPLDKLSIKVFQAKDLSLDGVQVDTSGQIEFPLIGNVQAAGKTTNALSKDIAERLSERYLQSPQVSVIVLDATSQKVAVEGEVKSAGVYRMSGRTTLMEAIAQAGGPSDEADLNEVAVTRLTNGARKTQVYDYSKIREGDANDPVLKGEDIVVVRNSATKTAWNDILKTLPVFTIFSLVG
jgi:polysaccharide export outer membrane protein